jgi:hypothetical protein
MRDLSKTSVRLLRIHWIWPLALLTLPGCVFHVEGLGPLHNLDQGALPQSGVVFCDIEKPEGRHCASADEIAMGMPLSAAAVALASGQTSDHALDYSADALARCAGQPEVVQFFGAFPEGEAVCLNCSTQIPAPYADAAAVCTTRCYDDADGSDSDVIPPTADTTAFCASKAHVSTNFVAVGGSCIADACVDAGTLKNDFADPRRAGEPVVWGDLVGTTAALNTLTRSAPTTMAFDAGAASTQVITGGDAYVEFTVNETDTTRLGGLSEGAPPDGNQNFTTIGWGIDLFREGCFYVFELGVFQPGGAVNTCSVMNAFGTYATGHKFRVNVKDKHNGTAEISYSQITASCTDGMPCPQIVFYTSPTAATYPLRVDSSFREQGGTLGDVKLVRIR